MRNKRYKSQIISAFLLLILAITGCTEQSDLGLEILPTDDLIKVKNVILKDGISTFTFNEELVPTGGATKSLLGNLTDPVFGNTTIDFAAQFRLFSFPDYGENPVADSLKLFIYYRLSYGDTVTPQIFRVYELESPLDIDAEYFQDVDLKSMASVYLLGETEYTPTIGQDSATGEYLLQLITIPLDLSLAEKLINADSTQMINNDVFLEFFKGLYIESQKLTSDGGTILTLEAASTSAFQGSALVIYYNNDENIAAEVPDTLLMPFIISEYSARVNSMNHDYSGTPFEANLNSEVGDDSLIYIQATGGLKSRILIDDVFSWKDSLNIAINKAELIFQVDTIASDIENFAPPSQLLFTVVDEEGTEFLPIDYVFSPDFYGGYLWEDYTYRFNITQHLQQIIEGKADNFGFFLTPAQKNNEANRVILKGSNSSTGVKLVITYSKFSK